MSCPVHVCCRGLFVRRFTFAKGVTAAFLPLSGVAVRDHVFDYFRENPVGYGSTYFAHPTCCAAAYATLQHIIQTNLVQHVKSVEPVMKEGLARLVDKHPSVKSARTTGLGGGFDLAGKDGNFLMYMHEASQGVAVLKEAMRRNGIVSLMRGHHVLCTPPLVITAEEVCSFVDRERSSAALYECTCVVACNTLAGQLQSLVSVLLLFAHTWCACWLSTSAMPVYVSAVSHTRRNEQRCTPRNGSRPTRPHTTD